MATIEIVRPNEKLKPGWRTLYGGYATFYKRNMTDAIAETVWGWLNNPAHELDRLIALVAGVPVWGAFQPVPKPSIVSPSRDWGPELWR